LGIPFRKPAGFAALTALRKNCVVEWVDAGRNRPSQIGVRTDMHSMTVYQLVYAVLTKELDRVQVAYVQLLGQGLDGGPQGVSPAEMMGVG
jgi:hypothetical protein